MSWLLDQLTNSLFPTVFADESEKESEDAPAAKEVVEPAAAEEEEEAQEFVDPKKVLDEQCAEGKHCAHARKELELCTQRVEGNPATKETCTQEFFDFWHCVDHCAAEKLFTKLK